MAHTAHIEITGKIGFFPIRVGECVGATWTKGQQKMHNIFKLPINQLNGAEGGICLNPHDSSLFRVQRPGRVVKMSYLEVIWVI